MSQILTQRKSCILRNNRKMSRSQVGATLNDTIQTFLKKHECVNRCHNIHLSHDRFAEHVHKESDEE
jgi:ribosomal protein S16